MGATTTAQRADERRRKLLPLIADAFRELGYRRTTTAKLARRCRVQEQILYRLWKNKKTMFTEAIDYLRRSTESIWADQGKRPGVQGGFRALKSLRISRTMIFLRDRSKRILRRWAGS